MRATCVEHAVFGALLAACGATPEPRPEVAPRAIEEASAPAAATACAVVHLGFDLRVFGGLQPSPQEIDHFVGGEAIDIADLAPPGPRARNHHEPATGVLYVFFDAASQPEAIARCEATLAAYVPTAPSVPVIMQSAVQVTEPCSPCPP